MEQIPASTVADIEIITTPSARYKTDGDAGIINIVTKRQTGEGLSGAVGMAGSTLGAWNGDVLLAYRKGPHRWYVGGTGAEIRGKSDFGQQKTTIVDDYTTTSDADGTRHSNNASYIGRFGWEYGSRRHRLSLEFQGGDTKNARGGDMGYYEHRMQGTNVINDAFYDSHDRYSNEKQLAQLLADYSFRLNERGDRISITGRLRYDWYALEYTESNMFDTTGARYEGTRGYEKEHHWDFDGSAVYEMNYREQGKLEIGYQYTSYSEHGDYNITYWDRAAQDFQWQDDLYAPFFYRRQIHSLYAMLNDRIGPVAFDAGLRADNTLDELAISVAGADRDISRLELFPSLHASYEAPHGNTFSVGYSYRTNRPGIWQLEPYITYEDYYQNWKADPKDEFGTEITVTDAELQTIEAAGPYRREGGTYQITLTDGGRIIQGFNRYMNQTDKLSGVENAQGQDVGDGIFILKDSFTHDPDAWYVQVGARVSDGYDGSCAGGPIESVHDNWFEILRTERLDSREEAEALLAGIVLDTKGFTMRTGSRTFETAAFLRKSGADTAQVNKFFQNDLRDTVTKFHIIQGAHTYRGSIALALTDRLVGRAIAGQAADELLNIAGIEASFVLFPEAGQAYLSARSNSDVNVQVISEMLGGGGNAATAGAQFPGKTPEEVLPLLKNAIDTYFDDEKS